MRRTKADVERYISTVQSASPSQKARPEKGFLFAKLYYEAKEYELAKRHVSEYLTIQPKDPKAHKFLGQLFVLDRETDKAVGCYKRSLDLNPAQHDLVLKVAELLCGKPDHDSRAEFWVEKAARLLPGNPTVFSLREKLLSTQSGSNQLYELLQSELKLRPTDTHINCKLVQRYRADSQLEDAVKHCLAVEKAGILRDCLEWYELLVSTLQEYLCQPSVSNQQASRKFHKELLLAQCSHVRLTLALKGCKESTAALLSFDNAMQALKNTATNTVDELAEVFTEMRAHLYLYAGTLLLKRAQDWAQQWRAVLDLATLCYLISYQAPRPKAKSHEPLELLACDRQSQAGHMLLNLSQDVEQLLKDVVEAFGNRIGPGRLFDELFGSQTQEQLSFICNDDIHMLSVHPPKPMDLAKWDSGAVLLHTGDLQQLAWLGLQWALMGQSASLQDWLKQLFPRLTLETSKLDTNAPESICLLDLEVFVCGVVFCSQAQLEEKAKMSSCSKPHEPRCLPLHIMKQLLSDRQREWWNAVYSLVHKRAPPEATAKLRLVIRLGLSTLRAGEDHGLQPALLIHWAKHLTDAVERVNSYNEQKDYAGRSVHYWKVVLPLLEKVRHKHGIPEPVQPMFMHFRSKDIQPSQVRVYEEDAVISFAILLDIEGNTEEAIAKLEKLNSISSNWHLAKIYQRLSEEEENRLEETQGRCTNYLQMFRKYLTTIYQANAEDIEKLPVSMEEVMDSLNEVNQQLEDTGEVDEAQVDYPLTSSPCHPAEGHVKFSTPSLSKSVRSPYKRSVFSPIKPPHWVTGQKSLLQMLCQQVKALQNEVYDLRHNSSDATTSSFRMYRDNYAAEGLQETFPAAQRSHGSPFTGPSVYNNQSPANNSQNFLRTTADVTPTKGPVYGMNHFPPQQHMYAHQQSTHTPPLQSAPTYIRPQEQVFGPPIRFESPATSFLSPYSEEYYGHNVPQPTVNPTLPEPGYFTKQCAVTSTQPPRRTVSKAVDLKMSFGSQFTSEPAKVPNSGEVAAAQTTSATTGFKFNSKFKSNDGDFTFSSAQVNNSECLLELLTSDIPSKVKEPKLQTQDQPPSQSGFVIFGSEKATGFSITDGAQNKINIFDNTDQRFSFSSRTKPILGNSEAREEKEGESDDSTHVEDDEDGPHFEPIVPLPDKVKVKTGEEEEEEMFCERAKLFRFDSETKEWKERGIGSIKILKHKTSRKVRLLMRREQVLKICANHYITADMALKPNAGSDKSWVWYAMDYADEMPKTEQLAIRFKTAGEAALFKVKFEEAQKFISESPQGQKTENKCETPQPQISSKKADLKTLFSKKEGEWDCDVCCVRNVSTSAVCVACGGAAPSTAQVKPLEELKGSGPVAPPDKLFSFGLSGDSAKSTASTDVSSKGFTFGSQTLTFKFGSNDAAEISAGFGAQAEKKTIQANAPQHEKMSTAPAIPFGTGFGAQFAKKEGQWDCDTCLVRNDASATECVSCKTPCSIEKSKASGLAAMFAKKVGQWDCDTCLVRNEGSSSHCVSCQTANPNIKNKASAAPSSSSFPSSFGSSSSQPAATGFKANFNPGSAQFGTSKEKVSPEGFKFESSSAEAEKSSSSSSSFSLSMPVGGFKFGIAESEAKPSDRKSQSGSASELKNIAEHHKEEEKEAAPSSSDQSIDADSHDNNPLFTGKPNTFSFADLAQSQDFQFGQKDPTFKGFAEAGKQRFTGLHSNPKADITVDQDDEMYKTKENDNIQFEPVVPLPDSVEVSTEAEKSSSSSIFSLSMPVGGFKFGIAESEAKPSDRKSQSGSASDLLKNIAELHKEKEKEAAPSSSDQSVDPDSHDNNPLYTGKPNTFSFADLAQSQDFQFGQKDPTFKGFAEAGKQRFTGLHSNPKADITVDQDDEMYKTKENDNIQFEPVVPLPDSVEVSTEAEKSSSSSIFSLSMPAEGFKFGIAEFEAKPSDRKSQSGSASELKNIAEHQKEEEKEAAPSSSDQSIDADSHDNNPLFTGKPNTFSFADLAQSQDFQFGQKDPTFKGFAEAGKQRFTGLHSNPKADITVDQDDEMYKTKENDNIQFEPVVPLPDSVEVSTEAEKSSSSSIFSLSMPVGGFKFGIAESEAKPSDRKSQSGSASDLLKNIAELHKEKEKEAAPSSSDQSVDPDSHDNNPLFTGKPNTFSFADLAQSQDFQFGQKDPTFKGFAEAGKQRFTGLHSNPKADITVDQDDEMYKTKENDNIQFEPVVPLPDSVEVSTEAEKSSSSSIFSLSMPAEGFKFGIAESEAKSSDRKSQSGSASELKNIAEHHKEEEKEAAPSSSDQSIDADSHYNKPLFTGKPNTFSFADLAQSQDFQFGQKDPTFKGFAEAGKQRFTGLHSNPKADITVDQDDEMYKTKENDNIQFEPVVPLPDSVEVSTEAEKSSSSSIFSLSMPVGGFKFGIAESEAKPSDRKSQSGSASDLLKNIAELHKEKEKEAAPSSSDQSVDPDSHDNNPLYTGKPNTFSFADLAQSQDFQFGQKDPTFKGFAEAGKQRFTGLHSNPKADITVDQDDEMYKTKENDNIQFEPVVPLPDSVEVSTEAEKSSSSSIFSLSMPAEGFKFGIAEFEAKPSDRKSQSGSASDLLKNIAELHKEKEKEAAPSSSDQSVDPDSHDNNPLFTGKPNTFSFADLAQSQDFQFGQKDPTFKGFAEAGKQRFTGLHSNPKADITVDQDDEMYKTKENDNIQFEPVVPLPDSVEVSTEAEKSSSSSIFSLSMPAEGFKFGIAESEAKSSDRKSQSGSASELKNIAEHHKEEEKEAAPSSSDQSIDADSHYNKPLFTGKPNTFSFADLAQSQDFQFGQKDPTFKGFAEAGKQRFTGLHSNPKADITVDQDDEMYKTKENDNIQFEPVVPLPDSVEVSTEAEKSSSSSFFSLSMPVGGFKFGIAESEAKPSDRKSQSGSASDLLKNIAEHHKEEEKEAAPSSSDQSVDPDSHYNKPLFTGKPNTFSFADLAQSQDFQFGQKDPTFKGFAEAGKQRFTGLHSNPKADITVDQDDEMYKTKENDNIQFEPVVPLPDSVEVSTEAEKSSSSSIFSLSMPAEGFKFGIAESEAKSSDRKSQSGSASELKNIAEHHKEEEKEAAPNSSDQSIDADSHYNKPLFTGKPNTFSFADLAQSQDFQFGQKDPTFKGFAEAGKQRFTGLHSNPKADITVDQDDEMYKTKENDNIQFEPVVPLPDSVEVSTEAEKSSSSSIFSLSMPVGGFKFGIAESEAKPSDRKSQSGSASDLLKNIAELHKEKEKEAAPSSSDQSVDADSHDNNPLFTGKPNTFSFADLAQSQDFQFGQKDPNFKGFAEAGKQLFTGLHSNPKADQFQTPGAKLGTQSTKTVTSPPKFVFGSDSLQKISGSLSPLKEKSPVTIFSSKDGVTAVSRLKTSGPAVTCQSSVVTPFSISTEYSEVTLEREEQSTANEEQRASSDSEAEAEKPDNFNSEKLQEAQVKPKPSHDAAAVDTNDGGAEECQTVMPVADGSRPIDHSIERSTESNSSTATGERLSSGFASAGVFSFAELAKGSGEITFCKKDDNFAWSGAGATVFGSTATQNEGEKTRNEEEEGSDDKTDEIHLEPIVSLPEVEVKFGEEDEERREQVLEVCANRTISQNNGVAI
ncbi:E3 SUMO-protein ligase RanBP2-like [Garra rufa]|uniref:E3 SUMO-protein ligase RanBP2-like n=1 Tax=Garra rufa TaxID=137080 RepID=UPI003CCED0D9